MKRSQKMKALMIRVTVTAQRMMRQTVR
jgi:hypothetical protein